MGIWKLRSNKGSKMQTVYKYCNSPLKNTQKSESNSLESWDPSLFVRMEDHVVKRVGQSLKLSSEFYSASFCVFQFSSDTQSCLTLCNPVDCRMPGFPDHHQLLDPTQIYVHWVSDAIQPSHPLSSPSPPTFNLSQHWGLFKWVSYSHQVHQSIRVSALATVLPLNIQDWFPLGLTSWISLQSKGVSRVISNTAVQKHQSIWHSAFFIVQLSHPYMTTGKTIALTRRTFAGRVKFLLFNTLSRFIIAFLPRIKCLLISWLQSPSAVILEPPQIKSLTVSFVSPCICHEGTRCHDLSFLNIEL